MARGFDTTLAAALVDGRYGKDTFEHPERLVKNADADPKDWERVSPKYQFTADNVDEFTKDELALVLNYTADLRAQWRISNMKATIANKGRESAVKMVDKIVLGAIAKYNADPVAGDNALVDVIDSIGKSEVIRVCTKNHVMVPKHPLLAK